MKKAWMLLILALFAGCATPPAVKQAIKQQSEAYTELQAALTEFNQLYNQLNDYLNYMNQQSQLRIEALATVYKLSGGELPPETKELNPFAYTREANIDEIASALDTIPPNRAELLKEINKSISALKQAFEHGQKASTADIKRINETLAAVNTAHSNAMGEIRALMVMHDAVGEYLGIDLTPEAAALKEAITNIKALRK